MSMMRVPNVRLNVDDVIDDVQPLLVHGRVYDAVIERIDEPAPMRSLEYMFRVMFVLNIDGQKLYVNYPGLPPTVSLIYRNRHLWLGSTVKVRIRVVKYHEDFHYHADIQWENKPS